jgi:hypothetical protein
MINLNSSAPNNEAVSNPTEEAMFRLEMFGGFTPRRFWQADSPVR